MDQKVARAAIGDPHASSARRAAAAELGRDEDLAQLLGRGVVHADRVELEQLHAVGRIERLHRGDAALLLLLVRQLVGGSEGKEVEGPAAGMEVEHDVGLRQQKALEVVGDLLGDAAVGAARKDPVQVAGIDRRGSPSRRETPDSSLPGR